MEITGRRNRRRGKRPLCRVCDRHVSVSGGVEIELMREKNTRGMIIRHTRYICRRCVAKIKRVLTVGGEHK